MDNRILLISYFENAIMLEKNVYELKELKSEFQSKLKNYQNIQYKKEEPYLVDGFKRNAIILSTVCFLSGIIFLIITQYFWSFFVTGGGFGFLFLTLMFINSHNTKEKNKELQKTNSHIREINASIKKKHDLQCKLLTQNISEITKKLNDSESLLRLYYSQNIVFEKYQNLVSICTFLEYFKSGRCDTLIGHEGAYNLYENELRLDLILEKVDQVISRLDNIQNNQHTLYNAITESNSKISHLCNTTENMLSHIECINSNTALVTYTSSIAAINSTCQTWLMDSMLKQIKNK